MLDIFEWMNRLVVKKKMSIIKIGKHAVGLNLITGRVLLEDQPLGYKEIMT